jgi:hypothetical protein
MSLVFHTAKFDLTLVFRDLYGKRSLICQASETDLLLSSELLCPDAFAFEMPANSLVVIDHKNEAIQEY